MNKRFTLKFVVLTLALTLLPALGVTVQAGPFEDGDKAFEQGNYHTAINLWKPIAEQGNAKAQYNLGVMYDQGIGVPQDYTEAVKWFRKAAEQGNVYAQTNLGVMYDKGEGVPQDDTEAVKWYRKAAERGLDGAQNILGTMYQKGEGVPQDHAEAVKWYRKAAEQGEPPWGQVLPSDVFLISARRRDK